jgi:superfamily I DNA/RNA helicase
MAWSCQTSRHGWTQDEGVGALARHKLPHQVRRGSGSFRPNQDRIKRLTMYVSKGLEFSVVARLGVGQMPAG